MFMEMTAESFEPVAERLRLLADATRLRILDVLRDGERGVVEIVGAVGASQPNVSRHLALLLRAGIVARRPDGRQVYYRIVDPFVDQICEAICGSLRAHVDRQARRLPGGPARRDGRPAAVGASPRATTITWPRGTTRRRRT
jgi:DNA-binding transcriptional ArsR family regulator